MLAFPTIIATPPTSEYERLAAGLGFENPALQHRRVISALTRDEIPVYRLDRVEAHLTKIASEDEKRRKDDYHSYWWWRPLRVTDAAAGAPCSDGSDRWFNGFVAMQCYRLAVPQDALRLATRVCAVVPEARLFVSDIIHRGSVADADPFMAVWGGLEMVPFAVWDEPGF